MLLCDESKPFIFISYSHKDTDRVLPIIDRLSNAGFNVWYDEGIDPGTEWDETIAEHVVNSSYFIAFVSNNYIESKNCKDELNYSRDLDKEQFLVYLENVELPKGMAMRMNRIQALWWNKYEGNEEEAYKKLFSAKGIEKTKVRDTSTKATSLITEPAKDISKTEETIAVSSPNEPSTNPSPSKILWIAIAGVAAVILIVFGIVIFANHSNAKEVAKISREKDSDKKDSDEKDSDKKNSSKKESDKKDSDEKDSDVDEVLIAKISEFDPEIVNNTNRSPMNYDGGDEYYCKPSFGLLVWNENEGSALLHETSNEIISITKVDNYVYFLENNKPRRYNLDTDTVSDLEVLSDISDTIERMIACDTGCFLVLQSSDRQCDLCYIDWNSGQYVEIASIVDDASVAIVKDNIYFIGAGDKSIYKVPFSSIESQNVKKELLYTADHSIQILQADNKALYANEGNGIVRYELKSGKIKSFAPEMGENQLVSAINVAGGSLYYAISDITDDNYSAKTYIISDSSSLDEAAFLHSSNDENRLLIYGIAVSPMTDGIYYLSFASDESGVKACVYQRLITVEGSDEHYWYY